MKSVRQFASYVSYEAMKQKFAAMAFIAMLASCSSVRVASYQATSCEIYGKSMAIEVMANKGTDISQIFIFDTAGVTFHISEPFYATRYRSLTIVRKNNDLIIQNNSSGSKGYLIENVSTACFDWLTDRSVL